MGLSKSAGLQKPTRLASFEHTTDVIRLDIL